MADASYENVKIAADYIRTKSDQICPIGIICGSGLGGIGDIITDVTTVPYKDIPGFHSGCVHGHKGNLLLGTLAGKKVVCMQGRMHGYEGIPYSKCAFPIRVMKLLGMEKIIITHAAGSLEQSWNLGDFMVLKDHLNFAMMSANSPLVGPNEDKFGPRFVPLSNAYNKDLQALAFEVAKEQGISSSVHSGVNAMFSGPCYETIAECRMAQMLGAHSVGMSVIPEVHVARHCDVQVLAISMLTNIAVVDYERNDVANHEEVLEIANKRAKTMETFVMGILEKL